MSSCSEEEELDLFYLEIERRILLLISEEEEEEEDRPKMAQLKPINPKSEIFGKKKELCIHGRNIGGGRKGTGVFIPKFLVPSC